MAATEIRRVGIDVTQNVWDLLIYGDPSVAPGFNFGVGSRAAQFDSTPVGIIWYKFGTGATDWRQVFFDGTVRTITLTDLPDIHVPVAQADLDLGDNPLLAEAAGVGLRDGSLADIQFRLKGAAQ